MGKQTIDLGTVDNDGTGDPLKTALGKTNDNFDEIYDGGDIDSRQYTEGVSNPAHKEGLVFYDSAKDALSYYNDDPDVTVNLGQELLIKVYNNNGQTILNGEVVRLDGGIVGGVPTVLMAQSDTVSNANSIGVATHDIEVGTTGYATAWGTVGDVDTSSFTPGDTLFISETVAGELTNTEQGILKPVAQVLVSDASVGVILVSQKPIINITAIGQMTGGFSESQSISTTPAPLAVYTGTPFEKNVTVNLTGADPFEAEMLPASIGATGFYDVSFSVAMGSVTNALFFFELYVNSLGTGIVGVVDLSNNNTDAGSTSFAAITPVVIDNTIDLEIYIYSDSGTPTAVVESCVFNIKRIGNV